MPMPQLHPAISEVVLDSPSRPGQNGRIPPIRKPYPWNVGRQQRLPHNLSQDQTRALLAAAAAHPRDHALLNLMYRYGLRPGEAGRLLLTDLDFDTRSIRINRLKGGLGRELPLFESLIPVLTAWLDVRRLPANASIPPPFEQDVLFPSRELATRNGRRAIVGITTKRVHQIVAPTVPSPESPAT